MLDSMLMAFSLYSRIPVPQAKWNDESMRWCICFLPLVGLVIGAAQWAAFALLTHFSFGPVLRGAVLAVLPILLSGGIHMDGFMDTCDAIHSYGSREKRLEILKDPHVGAFAVIGGIVYFVLDFGIWSEAGKQEIPLLCLIFVLSRALSAFPVHFRRPERRFSSIAGKAVFRPRKTVFYLLLTTIRKSL